MKILNASLVLIISLLPVLGWASLEVHEWGTFTSLLGSNGITQNGMYHEDEELPKFVHGIGETQFSQLVNSVTRRGCGDDPWNPPHSPLDHQFAPVTCKSVPVKILQNNLITQKMETPVVYFYSDRPQRVQMNVQFPEGVVTESFPAPSQTSPALTDDMVVANGNTTYDIDVLAEKTAVLPGVNSHNIYSHARHVASNVIRSGSEYEKFVFYRGLGRFQPQLAITSRDGNLTIAGPNVARPQAAFLIHVNAKGDARVMTLGDLRARASLVIPSQSIKLLENHNVLAKDVGFASGLKAKNSLREALTLAGLKVDEATAMLDTWERGYLRIPGLRLLYIMPRSEVDQILPLNIFPKPDHLVRVFVARMEILLDTQEARIATDIIQQKDAFDVSSLGRFSEPILHRISEVVEAEGVTNKGLFERLIGKSFAPRAPSSSVQIRN